MKHILASLAPRLTLLGGVCACLALAALLALAGPLQIVISIQPLGSPAAAAPALILPTVTPPPPPTEEPPTPSATSAPPSATSTPDPAPTELPPTATSTALPVPTELPPTEVPTEAPPSEEPPAPPAEPTAAPPAPTEMPPAPTEMPPAPTEAPPAPTAAPPAPTEVPPAPTEVPTPAPVTSSERHIERAPDNLPSTADPEQAARFMTSYLPLIILAIACLVMGWLVQRGAFRQHVLVDLGPRTSAPQPICLGEIQLDAEQIRARWQAGASVASLVDELARRNRGVSQVALTLAVQEALQR